MSIEHAILGYLSWRPLTGYELKKLFAESAFLHWSGNNNQIYRTLVQLHRDGQVTLEVQHQESLPSRKRYSITEAGVARLKSWLTSAPELPERRSTFLVQLAWADLLTQGELEALLARYQQEIEAHLAMAQEQARRAAQSPGRTGRERFLWKMLHENAIRAWQAELGWAAEVKAGLTRLPAEGTP